MKIFPSVQMNQQLELQAPLGQFGERPKYEIGLILKNNASDQIILPGGSDFKIFFYSNQDGWQEIRNLYSRNGREEILDPKASEWWKSSTQIYVMPDPKETEGKDDFRVVVLGFVYQNGKATNTQVGAFLDVKLSDFIK